MNSIHEATKRKHRLARDDYARMHPERMLATREVTVEELTVWTRTDQRMPANIVALTIEEEARRTEANFRERYPGIPYRTEIRQLPARRWGDPLMREPEQTEFTIRVIPAVAHYRIPEVPEGAYRWDAGELLTAWGDENH